jgi:hypothetical protein
LTQVHSWRSARTVLKVGMFALLLTGCSMLAGGNGNPRTDIPAATPPPLPSGAAVWSSIEWQAVEAEQPIRASEEQFDQPVAVAAGPGGWVAVGSNSDVTGYVGRIWQSADSVAWDLLDSALLDGLELVEIAATPDAFIAIGTNSTNPNDPTASVLHSPDGRSWTVAETIQGAWAASIASGPAGFALVLQVGERTEVLLSADGRTWQPVPEAEIGQYWIADIAWDSDGWIAAGSAGNRAVVLRQRGGGWTEEAVPVSEPVDGILDVNAYQVVPGRWATLVLGLDNSDECAEDDDFCPRFQAGWVSTNQGEWTRLPDSNWLFDRGYGVRVHPARDAGFVYFLGDEVLLSANGWEWTAVAGSPPGAALTNDLVVTEDRLIAVGTGDPGTPTTSWFASGLIRP